MRRGEKFFNQDIKPLVSYLQNNPDHSLEIPIKNYLVVRLVSILEDFFKSLVIEIFNDDLPLSILFAGEVKMPVGILNEMLSKRILTKGHIVANEFNFANARVVNSIFTELLRYDDKFKSTGFEFFPVIKRLDGYELVI